MQTVLIWGIILGSWFGIIIAGMIVERKRGK